MSLDRQSGTRSGMHFVLRDAPPSSGQRIREDIIVVLRDHRALAAEIRLALAAVLAWLKENDRYQDACYRRFADFCKEILDIAGSTADERIRVREIVSTYPALGLEYRAGRIADRAVIDLAAVLEGADEAQVRVWVERALHLTTRELRALIRAAKPDALGCTRRRRGPSTARRTSRSHPGRFPCSRSRRRTSTGHGGPSSWSARRRRKRSAEMRWNDAFLFERRPNLLREGCHHARAGADHRSLRPLVRGLLHCMVPGCSARRHLHDHHIEWRSRGGSNALFNRIALCAYHHNLLHEGKITVTGRADGDLYWRIGVSQPRYYRGNRLLRKSWDPSPRDDDPDSPSS